jgi:hypothetical protein
MPTATQSVQFSNIAATTAGFSIYGGSFGFSVVATFGGGNVVLQLLGPDQTTWLNAATALTANGFQSLTLPPGIYRIAITTATAVYAALTSVLD